MIKNLNINQIETNLSSDINSININISNTPNTNKKPQLYSTNMNFNIDFIWKEVEACILKIIGYLKDNKVGEEIKEIFHEASFGTNYEKLEYILLIIDKALRENLTEALNVFFIEFYRLCALFVFCVDDRSKSYEILNRFILKISDSFKNKEESEIPIDLVVEMDKLILNKAQMLFWDEKYKESLQIILTKLEYFHKDTTDEMYCLKMVNYMISILNYKAWIHAFQHKEEESEESFLLAIQMVKDSKKLLFDNFKDPDLNQVYKRKVKTYHQYMNFLNYKISKCENINTKYSYTKTAFELVKEIIRILNKDTFEFDEDILRSHLIFYYLQAALYSTSIKCNEEKNLIDLENTLTYLVSAHVENITQDLRFKIRFRLVLSGSIFKVTIMIMQYGQVVSKPEEENKHFGFKSKLSSGAINFDLDQNMSLSEHFHSLENRLNELLLTFDEKGNVVMVVDDNTDLNKTVYKDYYNNAKFIKNYALYNIQRFSDDSMMSPMKGEINEIFVVEYVCNKLLLILAEIMESATDVFKNFTNIPLVMESLNGYLIVKEDSMILVTTNSVFSNYKECPNNSPNMDTFEKYINSKILNELKLEKTEIFLHFYTKHHFTIRKDLNHDIFILLLTMNILYSSNLYKPSLVFMNHLISELEKIKSFFSGSNENKKTQGYLDLYIFFIFFTVKIYMKLNDYANALRLLLDISEYDYDYTRFLYNTLAGICLTKLRYSDLGAVLLEDSWNYIRNAFEEDFEENKKNIAQEITPIVTIDSSRISEDFIKPVKLFISVINTMKNKAIDKFQEELSYNPYVCYYCDLEKKKPISENMFPCLKCNRIYYCSLKCMKKMKVKHDMICFKYAKRFKQVNEILDKYMLR